MTTMKMRKGSLSKYRSYYRLLAGTNVPRFNLQPLVKQRWPCFLNCTGGPLLMPSRESGDSYMLPLRFSVKRFVKAHAGVNSDCGSRPLLLWLLSQSRSGLRRLERSRAYLDHLAAAALGSSLKRHALKESKNAAFQTFWKLPEVEVESSFLGH